MPFSLMSFCLSLRSEDVMIWWSLFVVSMANGGLHMGLLYTSELACRKQEFLIVWFDSVLSENERGFSDGVWFDKVWSENERFF